MHKLEPEELESRLELSERKRVQLQKKLTQKSLDEEIPLWSMVDLMTLLLIFFFFFYTTAIKEALSASQQDLPKDVSNLQIESYAALQEMTEASSSNEASPEPAPAAPLGNENKKSEQTSVQLREEILGKTGNLNQDVFSVSIDRHRLVFVLGEQITFQEGEAQLRESYQPVFIRLSDFIASKRGYQVVVSGHTDDKPIRTQKFPSNLELSSARAITVAKFLIENGVSPHRVSIQGFSEYRPLFEKRLTGKSAKKPTSGNYSY